MTAEVRDWLDAYRRAWEETDADAAAALFSEDAEYRANIYEEPYLGRSGVHDYWSEVTSTQRDVTVVMGEPFGDARRAAAEFWTTMKIGDDPVTLSGCLLLDFDDAGLCRRLREYWNFTGGTLAPPEVYGT